MGVPSEAIEIETASRIPMRMRVKSHACGRCEDTSRLFS